MESTQEFVTDQQDGQGPNTKGSALAESPILISAYATSCSLLSVNPGVLLPLLCIGTAPESTLRQYHIYNSVCLEICRAPRQKRLSN
jgi:hypothetical protein